MHVPFSDKNATRIYNTKTRHQQRREERMRGEVEREYQDKFGKNQQFGKRAVTRQQEEEPKRIFGLFKKKQ